MTSAAADGADTLLLTGAQGFLGRHVARAWLLHHPNGRVVGVGRSPLSRTHFTYDHTIAGVSVRAALPPSLAEPPPAGALEYRRLDVTDGPAVRSLVRELNPTAIVHSAAALRGDPLERLIESNVLATACVSHAAGGHAPQPRLVLVSSGSVYGLGQTDPATTESPDPYAVSKRAAERAAALESSLTGLPVVAARVFNLVGAGLQDRHLPGRVAMELAVMEKSSTRELRLGSLSALRDLIDVRDAAEAVAAAASADGDALSHLPERDGLRVLDVGTGVGVSMRDVVRLQIAAMGLEGLVDVTESEIRPQGAAVLRADPAALAALDAAPRISIEATMAEMASYARSQV